MTEQNPNEFQITLLRHGEFRGNAEGYHQGQAEFPLTEVGLAQAQALADWWLTRGQKFDKLISSPQSRAKQTAELIAGVLDLEIKLDPVWMERDNGNLSGIKFEEARVKFPQPEFINLYEPIGQTGESIWDLYVRGGQAITSVINGKPGSYLVVSHGGLLNMTMRAILGIAPQPNFQNPRFRFPIPPLLHLPTDQIDIFGMFRALMLDHIGMEIDIL